MMVSLEKLIENYIYDYPQEKASYNMLDFLRNVPDAFSTNNKEGHFTGSGWVVSPDKRKILMTHHKTLSRWLQLGGHADGENDLLRVALREIKEESGLQLFRVVSKKIFDLDIHKIPKINAQPGHTHYDVRFLFEADPEKESIVISSESHDVAWVPIEKVITLNRERSIQRMIEKTLALVI